jgi:predicted O-methyltransferase YrrM
MPPSHDVEPLYSFLRGCSEKYKQFCALRAAVELGLFDVLEHQHSVEAIADHLGTESVMTEDLCELLCDLGILQRTGSGYGNTDMSQVFLERRSCWFQGEVIKNLLYSFKLWESLAHVWETGPIVLGDDVFFSENNFVQSLKAQVLTGELQRTTEIISGLPEFLEARRLLDLGGGHGLYSVALCERNPNLEATIFDLPEIERYADSMLSAHHATRIHFQPGNLFTDDLGEGYDLVLLSYNPGGKNPDVLRRIYCSLNNGGLLVAKHAFYRTAEESKSRLLDIEWNLTALQRAPKERNVYRFAGDMSYEECLAFMDQLFDVLDIVEAPDYATPALSAFGDRLDSKIVIAKKKAENALSAHRAFKEMRRGI